MKTTKKITILILCVLMVFTGAQLFAEDDFSSLFADSANDSGNPTLEISGTTALETYIGLNDLTNNQQAFSDYNLNLNFDYAGAASDFNGAIKLNPTTIENNPLNIINELTYTAYLNDFVLKAGKSKIVWGRGDKLHVLDLFNANDYSQFILPDYLDRRIAEPMLSLTYNSPSLVSVQAVWTPTMTADVAPTSGNWATTQAKTLENLGTEYVTYLATNAYTDAYTAATSSSYPPEFATLAAIAASEEVLDQYSSSDAFLPDTNSLKYGQYGIRVTGTVGTVDLGAEGYYGHYKTPSVEYTASQSLTNPTTFDITSFNLSYDKLGVVGVDAETIVGAFNLRSELAYYMTDDTDGTDPSCHNPSLQYEAGADIAIPYNQLDLNVQVLGSYTLFNDEIKNNPYDEEYYTNKKALNNRIVAQLSDSYKNETIKLKATGIWNIERGDLVVMPEFEYDFDSTFSTTLSGAGIFELAENGEFEEFTDFDFVKLSAKYSF